jgi:hypothetical protein
MHGAVSRPVSRGIKTDAYTSLYCTSSTKNEKSPLAKVVVASLAADEETDNNRHVGCGVFGRR